MNKLPMAARTLLTCFFVFSGSVFAGEVTRLSPSLITQNGFYIGADIGAADLMNKESHSVAPESHQLGSMGAIGGILVGYDYGLTSRFRLAIEGFADAADLTTSLQHASNTYKMEQNYHLGIRVLPEYVFTPFTVGHLIIGYVNGRFHINDNGVYGLINTRYNQSGLQTGLGLTTTVRPNIFMRMDALYSTYASNTSKGVGLTTPSQFYTNRFSQLAGEFSVIYKFC